MTNGVQGEVSKSMWRAASVESLCGVGDKMSRFFCLCSWCVCHEAEGGEEKAGGGGAAS